MRTHLSRHLSRFLAGDLAAFGGPSAAETVAGYIRAEQLSIVLRHSPSMMLANACNATVLAIALWHSPDGSIAAIWAAVVVCGALFLGIRARASWRIAKPQFVSRRSIHRLVRNALILGSAWGVVPATFFADATNGGQLVITCLCAGMLAGGALAFATIPVAAIAFTGPILLGTAICIGKAGDGDSVYLLVAILVVVYACILLRGIITYSFEFTRRLIVQVETEQSARQDTLTQLPNRFAFNENMGKALEALARSSEGFAILMLDLDRFKEVNDQFGHLVGDEFLIQVATRLRRCARQTEFVARIGGDEFALIKGNPAGSDEVLELAERIVATFTEPFIVDGREIAGATSVGIAMAPRDGITANDLLKHVDVALYQAKRVGSGAIHFFEIDEGILARRRRELQHDLEGAIDRGELFVEYQPFLNLRNNRVTAFEALLRWRHPIYGVISPSEFIPIAEETGLIHPIGDWIIHQACLALSRWPDDIRIAVNLSASQFQTRGVLQTVAGALASAAVSPRRLEIEITESILISKYPVASSVMSSLLQLGVAVALDDFGTGYSSLSYLRKLPFSRIKIDQSFIRDMLTQPDCAAIVRSVIMLARDLRISVVAEGVETADQLDYLRQTTCDEVQGYLVSRPLSADLVANFLRRYNEPRAA
jgi:diguanylate cyclase (GGDEF)-like protein